MNEHLFILGVPNFANYESSTSLIRVPKTGGEIDYVCIGEERLSRTKHSYSFPLRGIDYCLRHFGLDDLDQVDYIATDYARVPRWLNSGPGYRKLEHDYLKVMLRFPRERILVLDHHDAHAASCYYPSGFDEAGVLVVDGMGSELNTQTAYHFRADEITWVERGRDWGVGRLYSFITGAVLPYGPEKGYGKVMGLAAYGEDAAPSGLDLAGRVQGMNSDYSHLFSRFPVSRLVASSVPQCHDRQDVMNPPFPRIAFETQDECERQFLEMADYIHQKTGTRKLCISGGVGLNGRANYRILRETPIEQIWIQPACSDSGIPFGLALWAWFRELRPQLSAPRCSVSMGNAYCGSPYSPSEIDKTLDHYAIRRTAVEADAVAELLADGKVIATFEGGSEYGPRSLGHRSILADPRERAMADHLNSSVKFREPYRPYAPAVMEEFVSEYFDHEGKAPFMLLVADVRPEKHDVIPAVTHIDGTARIQTVNRKDNGRFYDILAAFHKRTGVPVLLNTSFNVNREPIVETPLDALVCAFSTSIDFLMIEGRLIDCGEYRDPQLVARMKADREKALEEDYHRLTRKYLYKYDRSEIDAYLEEENRISEWHRRYRAKYELEKAMDTWRRDRTPILIVGTRKHTKCLYLYIPEFPSLNIRGFVACDEYPGEQGDFPNIYPEFDFESAPWNEVSAVLISSHEYQRPLADRVGAAAGSGATILTLYDDACDSLLYSLPPSWPVMNPREAELKGLSMTKRAHRTASNIDYDFEPSAIDIGERYGLAITYHLMRPPHLNRFRAYETPERFKTQVERLAENFTFSRARDFVDPNSGLPESNIVLTFDDGTKDFIRYAVPVLERYGKTATVYVCAQPYLDEKMLEVHKIELLMVELGLDEFRQRFYAALADHCPHGVSRDDLRYINGYQCYRYDTEELRQFKLDLNYKLPRDVVSAILSALFAVVFGKESEREAVKELYLSTDDLKRLVDRGFEVGVHTHHHRPLPSLDYETQFREMQVSAEFLTELTGERSLTAAYPFGFFDQHTKRTMKELGMLCGFTMGRRLITPKELQERWELPRYDVNDCFNKKTNEINYKLFSSLSTGD